MSTDTVAVDREALVDVLYDFAGKGLTTYADKFETRRAANAVADALLASGILRDAAAVRRKHGERIAKAIKADIGLNVGDAYATGMEDAARIARDLSPPP